MKALHAESTARLHDVNLGDAQRTGAFGVPTFVVDDGELFWGQDRLPLLREHLLGRRAPQ